jgi:hypothetical protein
LFDRQYAGRDDTVQDAKPAKFGGEQREAHDPPLDVDLLVFAALVLFDSIKVNRNCCWNRGEVANRWDNVQVPIRHHYPLAFIFRRVDMRLQAVPSTAPAFHGSSGCRTSTSSSLRFLPSPSTYAELMATLLRQQLTCVFSSLSANDHCIADTWCRGACVGRP